MYLFSFQSALAYLGIPLIQNFFIFMQFSGKIGPIVGWHPFCEIQDSPLVWIDILFNL